MLDALDYVEHLSDTLSPVTAIFRVASFIYRFARRSSSQATVSLSLDSYHDELREHQRLLNQLLLQVDAQRRIADTELTRLGIERDYIACQAELAKGIWENDRWSEGVRERAMHAWCDLESLWASRFPEALAVNASTPILVFRPLPLPR